MRIAALSIYPVKSLGPVALQSSAVEPRGLTGDRRWMIVDDSGRFVTRREVPALARIAMSMVEGGYRLTAPEGDATLPVAVQGEDITPVTVWRDTVAALVVDNEASRLISEVAGRKLRLAYMPDRSIRPVDPGYATADEIVSFADGFPILVTRTASLDALNAALEKPVTMARFRANIVLDGSGDAWAEEDWATLTAGTVPLRLTKPCARCIVVTQNPETGEREEGNAVTSTLRRLGKFNAEGVLFGMNAIAQGEGRIAVGDRVASGGANSR
ncbi:MAG: MOSC domain-containing protein [Sphingobium sp.]